MGNRAFDLVDVAVHEIGHARGLDHTGLLSSVLAPFVSPIQSFSGLDAAAPEYNYVNPMDVNGDGNTSALDALTVINATRNSSATSLTTADGTGTTEVVDDFETPVDQVDDSVRPRMAIADCPSQP